MKSCTRCKESKGLSEFYRRGDSPDGYRGYCKQCDSATSKIYYQGNRDELYTRSADRYKAKTIEILEKQKERRLSNLPKSRQKGKAYAEKYRRKHRDRVKSSSARWAKDNKDKSNATLSKRRASKLKAIPLWLSREDIKKMYELYRRAKSLTTETGIQHEVEHIVPLQGKDVCGLHVPWNLQVITQHDNRVKSNKVVR